MNCGSPRLAPGAPRETMTNGAALQAAPSRESEQAAGVGLPTSSATLQLALGENRERAPAQERAEASAL